MFVEKSIKQSELVQRAKHGQAYVCKSCYVRTNKIILVDYIEKTPNGVYNKLCKKCEELSNSCALCKNNK